jgi:hypothetical protein
VVLAGGVSAGVAVAAGTPAGSPDAASGHAARTSAGRGSGSAGAAADRPSPRASTDGRAAASASSATPATTAKPTGSPVARATSSPRPTAKPAAAARPYLIYDSLLPGALPSGHVVATYATGPGAVAPALLAGRGPVLWIDVDASDPAADVLDIEPGNAPPAAAPGWVSRRLTAYPGALAIIYTSQSEWPAVQAAVASLPAAMRARIRWWIADPTGYAHIVPGSDATQWYWGSSYDISTATPRF